MLLETKDRSSVDCDASFINESAVLSELRADLTDSAEETCLEKLNFIFRIPKIGCLLSDYREVLDEAHLAFIGEADSPVAVASWHVHLDLDWQRVELCLLLTMLIDNLRLTSVRRLPLATKGTYTVDSERGDSAGDLHVHLLVGESAEQHEIGPAVLTAPQSEVNLRLMSLMKCINPSSKQREKGVSVR